METKQSSQQRQDYIERMRHFVEHHCIGKLYDTCTVCCYRMSWGCSHPEHPANQKIPAYQSVKGEKA